jgi:hypothetical protein
MSASPPFGRNERSALTIDIRSRVVADSDKEARPVLKSLPPTRSFGS